MAVQVSKTELVNRVSDIPNSPCEVFTRIALATREAVAILFSERKFVRTTNKPQICGITPGQF